MTTLYFIRHGQSEANITQRFAGSLDTPLTPLGEQQAEITGECLKDIPFTAVYASDLQRAFCTGEAIAVHHGLEVITCQQLREISAGEWEGKSFDELAYSPDFQVWLTTIGLSQATGGESVAQLQERARAAVEDIVRRHPGETVCIATHATPIRVMECIWQEVSLAEMHTIPWVSNASVTVVSYDENGVGRLIERDMDSHLGAMRSALPANV